jgi:glycosyltransferase involved in cell wall biosynthesis
MNRIKVLYILPSLAKGGAERLILDLCNELNANPLFEVKLVILNPTNEYKFLSDTIDLEICNSKFIPSIFGKPFADLKKLNNIIQEFKPDIIHSNLFESEITSRKNIYPDIVYVTHCHDNMKQFQNFSYKTIFNKKLFTNYFEKLWLLKKYKECKNNFIVVSIDTKGFFIRSLPPSLHRITRIPNAVNLKRFFSSDAKFISKDKVINIISIGSLTDKKNHIFLINVMKQLVEKYYNVHLNILGEGTGRSKIQDKINLYDLNNYIELKGNVMNVEEYLHDSSIYVHPALYEPFGLAILEAMAAGLPCVCLDGKGNRDIIINEVNGYLIQSHDPALFTEKIISLIENDVMYNKMSNNALDFSKKYDIKIYSHTIAEYYKMIIFLKSK